MEELLHVDQAMRFIKIKRSSLKYRLKLVKRYGVEEETDDMLSFTNMLKQI